MLSGENSASLRRDKIFDIIVRSYVETAEPVGSRTISRRFDIGLSPASIRNVMADLEELGLVKQPHTSAGRIPTDKGYRHYVDSIMAPQELDEREQKHIQGHLEGVRNIRDLAEKVSKLVAELTGNASMIYIKNLKYVSFLNHILDELIAEQRINDFLQEETELFIEGLSRIFEQPEFHDSARMRLLLQAFDEKYSFLRLLLSALDHTQVPVHIGEETEIGQLVDVSVVSKDCSLGNVIFGGVAIVGPTRMDYSKVVAVVDYVADTVSQAVERF